MKEKEYEFLQNVVEAFKDAPQRVSAWEEGFMTSTIERVDKYGDQVYISAKQWGVISRIAEKLDVSQ